MEINKNIHDLDSLLTQVSNILTSHGVDHWLECGTLLGYVRDEAYLDWENDIDLGSFKSSLPLFTQPEILDDLLKHKIRCVIQDSTITLWHGGNVYLDINFYHEENDYYVMDRYLPKGRFAQILKLFQRVSLSPNYYNVNFNLSKKNIAIGILKAITQMAGRLWCQQITTKMLVTRQVYRPWRVPKSIFEAGFENILFRGVSLQIYVAAEDYLSYRYGENWKTPIKEWDTEVQDGSIVQL